MAARLRSGETLTCDCGGRIPRPLPAKCPHCGRRIAGVYGAPAWLAFAIVPLLFAVLIAFAWFLWRML
ncbi:MAG: hypothetical protein AB7O62_16575 [Pirellulales bacterium]